MKERKKISKGANDMIPPDNNSINYTQRKDQVAPSRESAENRPKKIPNARKEFKEVLQDKENEIEDTADSESPKDTSLMSLFSRPTKSDLRGVEDQKMLLETGAEVPSILQQPDQKVKLRKEIVHAAKGDNKTDADMEMPKEDKDLETLAKKGKFNSQYAEGQPDISYTNPHAQITGINPINLNLSARVEQTIPVKSPIHDIVVELIDQINIVQTKGQTDTVVTLNAPGIFKGAIVVMSEFDTANGQLNLAFENLTAQAKNLLDSLPNKESLLLALSKEGYTVQMYTTTTIVEHRPITSNQTEGQQKQREEQNDENEQNKKQK